MKTNKRSGALRESLHFQKKGDGEDDWGQPIPGAGDWETVFTEPANLAPRTGSETVTAARLEGRQPFVCTVRHSSRMEPVTAAWRCVDARAGNDTQGNPKRVYAIKSPPTDPDGKNQWLEFLIEQGAAS